MNIAEPSIYITQFEISLKQPEMKTIYRVASNLSASERSSLVELIFHNDISLYELFSMYICILYAKERRIIDK